MTNSIKTTLAVAVLLLGAGVFAAVYWHATVSSGDDTDMSEAPIAALPGDIPARLQIPSLNIDANVQRVGIAKSGSMAVPSNFTDVAWYRLGTVPGFVGSAVIDGHVDNGLSLAGVFKHLSDIQVGDEIDVITASSSIKKFVVSEVAVYPYKEVPLERLFNASDQARLNLITCEGAWIKGEKTYDQRLVVYATLNR